MRFVVVGTAKAQSNVTRIAEQDTAATSEAVRAVVDKALKNAA